MNTKYTKLFTGSNIIVNGLKHELDTNNITYIIKDKFESARLGGYGEQIESVEVHILNTDVEVAKSIIETYKVKIKA